LDGVLGLGQGAQQPVGEVEQLAPLADDRAQARVGPAWSWPGWGGHGAGGSLGRGCAHQFDETPDRNVRRARRLTFRGVASSDYRDTIQRRREDLAMSTATTTEQDDLKSRLPDLTKLYPELAALSGAVHKATRNGPIPQTTISLMQLRAGQIVGST
jgi:hypothetical protein